MRPALITLAALVSSLVLAAPADAHVTFAGDSSAQRALFQSWADSAKVPSPTLTVHLHEGYCPFEGNESSTCAAIPDAHNWEIWIPDIVDTEGAYGPPTLWWHLDFLQELAQVYDYTTLTPKRFRRPFDRIFNYGEGFKEWIVGLNETGEKFAMYYAYCGLGLSYAQVQQQIAYSESTTAPERGFAGFGANPTSGEYRQVCRLMVRLPR
jgi:hypothetical protein